MVRVAIRGREAWVDSATPRCVAGGARKAGLRDADLRGRRQGREEPSLLLQVDEAAGATGQPARLGRRDDRFCYLIQHTNRLRELL